MRNCARTETKYANEIQVTALLRFLACWVTGGACMMRQLRAAGCVDVACGLTLPAPQRFPKRNERSDGTSDNGGQIKLGSEPIKTGEISHRTALFPRLSGINEVRRNQAAYHHDKEEQRHGSERPAFE